jgi:2'-5' RNA ligase
MKNNWLSFTLPDDVRNNLYNLTQIIENKYQIKFKPMTKEDLHMTCIFLGKQLKKDHMDIIFQIIKSYNLIGLMRYSHIDFFPPNKKNLIVLRFITSQDVIKTVQKIKQAITDKLGYTIETNELIPHITLGKLLVNKIELADIIDNNSLKQIKIDMCFDFSINNECPLVMC